MHWTEVIRNSGLEMKFDELRKELSSSHEGILPHAILSTQQISTLSAKKPTSMEQLRTSLVLTIIGAVFKGLTVGDPLFSLHTSGAIQSSNHFSLLTPLVLRAYTNKLENKVSHLEEENERLKKQKVFDASCTCLTSNEIHFKNIRFKSSTNRGAWFCSTPQLQAV